METGDPYPIKMGFYAGNNLMSCTSMEPKRWHDAMVNTLEFCFTLECFMTPSAQATCDSLSLQVPFRKRCSPEIPYNVPWWH